MNRRMFDIDDFNGGHFAFNWISAAVYTSSLQFAMSGKCKRINSWKRNAAQISEFLTVVLNVQLSTILSLSSFDDIKWL